MKDCMLHFLMRKNMYISMVFCARHGFTRQCSTSSHPKWQSLEGSSAKPGKCLHSNGKPPFFLMGKTTINYHFQ